MRLPFSKATATAEGATIQVFLELTVGGYNGSTYTLTYDATEDALQGVYYQAVSKEKFRVEFLRRKADAKP